jgi:hypothetical protein
VDLMHLLHTMLDVFAVLSRDSCFCFECCSGFAWVFPVFRACWSLSVHNSLISFTLPAPYLRTHALANFSCCC